MNMNPLVSLLTAMLAAACLIQLVSAEDKKPPADKKICDKRFKIMSPDGESELGTYEIEAIEKESGKKIEISEALSLDYRGKKAELTSSVFYDKNANLTPSQGTTETKIDGKVCMTGKVVFSQTERMASVECASHMNKRTGAVYDPPQIFPKKKIAVPEGVVIFQSALPTLGPQFLSKAGTLENVVFVEFPDDLDELITFKENYRLVRTEADEKGAYDLEIFSSHRNRTISRIRFDKEDQIISLNSFGRSTFKEVKPAK